ncbi:transposable element Tcb2 transposase [Trichonephila clavipes]|nr:transposable element Tcb2 transposase [Trichonephila clavipes]
MMDGRTDLHFFDTGSVTAAQDTETKFLSLMFACFEVLFGLDFVFMDAPCHRAVLIDDFIETENMQRMSWPANS